MSREVRLSFHTGADKKLIEEYAKSRGHANTSGLLRVALHEYIRRHKPTEGTPLREGIDDFLGENKSV